MAVGPLHLCCVWIRWVLLTIWLISQWWWAELWNGSILYPRRFCWSERIGKVYPTFCRACYKARWNQIAYLSIPLRSTGVDLECEIVVLGQIVSSHCFFLHIWNEHVFSQVCAGVHIPTGVMSCTTCYGAEYNVEIKNISHNLISQTVFEVDQGCNH